MNTASIQKNSKKLFGRYALLGLNAVILFGIAYLIGSQIASAQIKNETTKPYTAQFTEFKDQIYANVSPENPGPNQSVTISIEAYSFDINNAQFTWKINGSVVNTSIGSKSVTFNTGAVGKKTTVEVVVDPKDRPTISKTFSFTPGEADILWQAEVYSHPFYKGKNLYTPESNVTFVAMPQNQNGVIEPTKTIFKWSINGTKYADKSGIARNTYTYQGPIIIKPVTVEVETYAPTAGAGDEKQVSVSDITIEPFAPNIRLYEDSPSLGILFNRALRGTFRLTQPEVKIAAYPFFQSITGKNGEVEYDWIVDDTPVEIPANQNVITLLRKNIDSGTSFIGVQSRLPKAILQTVDTNISLTFDRNSVNNNTTESEFGN